MQHFTSLLFSVLLLGIFAPRLAAQQEAQFTQFMEHKLGYNPAFAGAVETGTFTAIYRQQWLGFDDAPSSQLITFNTRLTGNGIGLGGQISRSTLGLSEFYTAEADYAYRINVGTGGTLGIGISTSVRLLRVDFTEAAPVQTGDESIPAGIQSKYVPNFGAGLYYDSPRFYLGISAPRLVENSIDLSEETTIISREARHMYAMAGIRVKASDKLRVIPQVLLKYVKGAPFDADANVTAWWDDSFYGGLSYRLGGSKSSGIGESVSLLFGTNLGDNLRAGFSYDLTLSEIKDYQSGSVEVLLQYAIGGRSGGEAIVSPRDF